MAIKDGGPAFPSSVAEILGRATNSGEFGLSGMTLRDYFAAKAMHAMLQAISLERQKEQGIAWVVLAEVSYHVAAAMLAERDKAGS